MSFRASCPSKIFLLGEYAVLAGGPALLASMAPRFELEGGLSSGGVSFGELFSPLSPAGLLLERTGKSPQGLWKFIDRLEGRGGLGASSAQFILTLQALSSSELDWKSVWRSFVDLTSQGEVGIAPSGADVVSQVQGGVVHFDPARENVRALKFDFAAQVLVFSTTLQAGRKVATHEHLAQLGKRGFPEASWAHELVLGLSETVALGVKALEANNVAELGRAFDHASSLLAAAKLECEETSGDREAFKAIKGVLGIKGSGALQSDALLVAFDGDEKVRAQILGLARARGLSWLPGVLGDEGGLKCRF
ncbi:hypothetical protein WDW86_11230 [Bdellovibrionota bacterium FG-2]